MIQEAVREFNETEESKPLEQRIIYKTFHHAGQAPTENESAFLQHLDKLRTSPAYVTSDRVVELISQKQRALDTSAIDEQLCQQMTRDLQL